MAKRLFEIARELSVTSKTVLEKCRAENVEIKNHMSTVSAGLEATICEWFSEEQATTTSIETTSHIDLKKARAEAQKQRRRSKAEEESEHAKADVSTATAVEALPEETLVDAEVAELQEAPAAEAPETAVAEIVTTEGEVEFDKEAPEAPAEVIEELPVEPPTPEPIVPAGPQVVPKPVKLKGPRVVRVEKPDHVPIRPAARSGSTVLGRRDMTADDTRRPRIGGKGLGVPGEDEGGKRGGDKRRSPRRRGGRTAGAGTGTGGGEKIREWRDRDLEERSQRLAAASGGGLRRHRASVSKKRMPASATVNGGRVEVAEPITVKNLSAATGIKVAEIIKKLFSTGVMATINQGLDQETAETIAADYGIELDVKLAKTAEQQLIETLDARETGTFVRRAPVVAFLGHVDHGKTSLLDKIRNTAVADGEAGGITQAVGAYRYDKGDQHVVFLDTPGHEAFTAMRARGANMTDVVVLVVAADDGVMPQTVEAINHAKAAEVPIVVALNKVDVPNANIQRTLSQLAERGLNPQQWGGDTEVIETSATTGQGIDTLVETLNLEAEILELQAEPDAPASGYVIESEMDPGRGVVAKLLVRNGTLKLGDILLAGEGFGRVRQIIDWNGSSVEHAGPATPIEVAGLNVIPDAGDKFFVVETLDKARQVAKDRHDEARIKSLAAAPAQSLEEVFSRIEAGQATELPLIIKADVQGSIEAIVDSLNKLSTDEVRVNILHCAVGGISTGDIALAEASGAIVIGFNVVAGAAARQLAETKGVDIRLYRVIYDLTGDVRRALEEGLEPEIREEVIGRAKIRQVFKVSRVGSIAGCLVIDGIVNRNAKVRITRDDVVIEDGRSLDSLKRFKDDVREVRAGMECGLKIAGYDDIKEGDILEFYQRVEVARTL